LNRGERLRLTNLAFVSPRLDETALQDRRPAGITGPDLARDMPLNRTTPAGRFALA